MDKRRLLKETKEAEDEAKRHLPPALKDQAVFYPEKLTRVEQEIVNKHLVNCDRCRHEVENTKKRRGFFSRQKEPCD